LRPRQVARITFFQNFDFVTTDNDVFGVITYLSVKLTVDGVPFEQVRKSVGIGEIVDGDDPFDVAMIHRA